VTAPESAVLYDFRAAPRISETLYGHLQGMQQRFAPELQSLFSSRLRQSVDVDAIAPASVTLPSYLGSCIPPLVRYICSLDRFAGQSMVCGLSPALASHVVARLFGGDGAVASEPRPLTELEHNVLRDLLHRALPKFSEAGRPHLQLDGKISSLAGDVAPPIASIGDSLIAVAWTIRCGAAEGTMTMTLPAALFADRAAPEAGVSPRDLTEQHVRAVTVPLEARLHLRLPASKLTRLHEGHVLETGKPSHAEVEISSNGRPLFAGVLGRHHGHVGVQLTRVITPELDTPEFQRKTPS
jgi:flagellar motor switch protein FliM